MLFISNAVWILARDRRLDESAAYMMYDFLLVSGSNPSGPTKYRYWIVLLQTEKLFS
jgi:hypothetical protein